VGEWYDAVRKDRGLLNAWRAVRENGLRSRSADTRKAVVAFETEAGRHLRRIGCQLRKGRFRFEKAHGVAIDRPGKRPRPIVVPPISNRVVQRRLLDILQEEPALQPHFRAPTSFGGIEGRGVRDAFEAVRSAMTNGACYFIRSDIKDFFGNIPRDRVLKTLAGGINDDRFLQLLQDAVVTELDNLQELGSSRDLFPIYDIGVAQGCCLSPLLGNILLSDFDHQMNDRGIVCLRYVDDFIILGPNAKYTMKAFDHARVWLGERGLSAYDPRSDPEKAASGWVRQGFEFLGCRVIPGLITPGEKSRKRLLASVDLLFSESERRLRAADLLRFDGRRYSVAATLQQVSHVLRGWGDQYAFCNNREALKKLDFQVQRRYRQYVKTVRHRRALLDEFTWLRLQGLHILAQSKFDPIEWKTTDAAAV